LMRFEPLNNEPQLLQQLAEGNSNAFRELYQAYVDQLYAVALLYLKQPTLAEDLVQSAFLKVWEHRAALSTVQSFASWLYVVARNLMIGTLRRQSTEQKYV